MLIVTFNSAQVIAQCLQTVADDVHVCLIDNASCDDTVHVAQKSRPGIQVIANRENIGFAAAVNMGARQANTEFVLLLNPDTMLAPGAIAALLARADAYLDAAIVAPVLYHPDGEQQTCYRLNVFVREKTPGNYFAPDGDLCAEFVSGAVMLWRMSDMHEIGFFDENFFFTYEDDDLCLRVRKAGRSIVVTPTASVTHAAGTSTPPTTDIELKKTRYVMASRLYLEQKYKGVAAARKLAVRKAGKYFLRTLVYLPFLYKKGVIRSYGRYIAALRFLLSTFNHDKQPYNPGVSKR